MKKYSISPVELTPENITAITKLIAKTWKHDYGLEGFLKYDQDYFRWISKVPGFDPRLMLGAYDNRNKLIGFNGVIPGQFRWGSKVLKGGISTYLAVDPSARRHGIARALMHETFRLIEGDYDILLAYFEFKQLGKKVYESALLKFGDAGPTMKLILKSDWACKILDFDIFQESIGIEIPMRQFLEKFKLSTLSSCIKPDRDCISKRVAKKFIETSLKFPERASAAGDIGKRFKAQITEYQPGNIGAVLELVNRYPNEFELSRKMSRQELEWYLDHKNISTLIFNEKKNEYKGFISYLKQTIVSKRPFQVAWVDNGNITDLAPIEQLGLINSMLERAKAEGCAIAVLPRLGYFNNKPFIKAGFLPYPRKFELHGVVFNPKLNEVAPLKKVYTMVR